VYLGVHRDIGSWLKSGSLLFRRVMSKYNLAQIGIEFKEDDTPMYWVYNHGYHPGQGGMEFTYGNFGTPDLGRALDLLKLNLVRDIDYVLEEIRRSEKKE